MPSVILKLKFNNFIQYSWPKFCVLCFKPATKEDSMVIGGGRIPYCAKCYAKKKRLERWKDNIVVLAFILGIIGGISYFVAAIVQHNVNAFSLIIGTGLFMGLAYVFLRLLLFPFQLLFYSKLAKPGVKVFKRTEGSEVIRIKFFNPEYAEKFRQVNSQYIIEG